MFGLKPKKNKQRPFLVYANITRPNYFEVGVVFAESEEDAVEIATNATESVFSDSYGLFRPLYKPSLPDQGITAKEIDTEEWADRPLIGYSVPVECA